MSVISRRTFLGVVTTPAALAASPMGASTAEAGPLAQRWSGAAALVAALQAENVGCVFGIPGAQENELWDQFKTDGLAYLLVTHEFSAAAMADGYARATGQPGVLCIVPGPGVTNSLSGLGEALLDSVPVVAIVGDVATGEKYRPFQVHEMNQVALLRPVTKGVIEVERAEQIAVAVRQAFAWAKAGEPGPVAVVVPYHLLIETVPAVLPPAFVMEEACDHAAIEQALCLLANRRLRIGMYVGGGCQNVASQVTAVAELLQAPVATSVSGKGVIPDSHPLAVGWGYGPQGNRSAERAFRDVDLVLAIGVKFSEVSTGFYSFPTHPRLIHVDRNPANLNQVMPTELAVAADAGIFLHAVLAKGDTLTRPVSDRHHRQLADFRDDDWRSFRHPNPGRGVDPMALVLELNRHLGDCGLLFVDVTLSEHWAAEAYRVCAPRRYFNPTDNQGMGWSIPASLGAQRAFPGARVAALIGDGCFLFSAMELSTAAREGLPTKFFVLDDSRYQYMTVLQNSAYGRTTATQLGRIDYCHFAAAVGVGYNEIGRSEDLSSGLGSVFCQPGPVLVRVVTDYGNRPVRWIQAVRRRYIDELDTKQKWRMAKRLGGRALNPLPEKDD